MEARHSKLFHYYYHHGDGERFLSFFQREKDTSTEAPSMAPSMAPSSQPTSSSHGIFQINNRKPFQWIWIPCLVMLLAWLSYRFLKYCIRRRRLLRSEQAGGMLGDLQMLPGEGSSDHSNENDDDDDDDGQEEGRERSTDELL